MESEITEIRELARDDFLYLPYLLFASCALPHEAFSFMICMYVQPLGATLRAAFCEAIVGMVPAAGHTPEDDSAGAGSADSGKPAVLCARAGGAVCRAA